MLTSPSLTSINLSPSGGSGVTFIGEGVDGMWTLTVTDGKKRKTGTPLCGSMTTTMIVQCVYY